MRSDCAKPGVGISHISNFSAYIYIKKHVCIQGAKKGIYRGIIEPQFIETLNKM